MNIDGGQGTPADDFTIAGGDPNKQIDVVKKITLFIMTDSQSPLRRHIQRFDYWKN